MQHDGETERRELEQLERLEARAEREEEALRETREEIREVVHEIEAPHRHGPVPVKVNNKEVILHDRDQTGLKIKEAAVVTGVRIQLDFVLSEELAHGRSRIVGDDQRIQVEPGACFEAIPNDDHSLSRARAMKDAVAEAVRQLQGQFGAARVGVVETGDGGARVVVEALELGAPFAQAESWFGFALAPLYPYADVYPHFIRPDASRADGRPLSVPIHVNNSFYGRPAVMVSRRTRLVGPANPNNALLKLLKVQSWLRSSRSSLAPGDLRRTVGPPDEPSLQR